MQRRARAERAGRGRHAGRGPALSPKAEDPLVHLRTCDPVLRKLIDAVGALEIGDPEDPRRGADLYGALVRSIVGQQLSVKAARSINSRLMERFGGRTPTPREVLDDEPEELRSVGLSRMKVSFLRSLAEHVLDGSLDLDAMRELSDEDVTAELIVVKGIGEWTAHMFLMFRLERSDVLPVGDLGVRSAVRRAYGLSELPAPADLEAIAAPWRPHRSLACRYLWASLDNEPA